MIVNLNSTYLFKFKDDFDALDGIYKVVDILAYERILSDEIDMYENLYSQVGKTEDTALADISNYVRDTFYKLEHADNGKIIYVPTGLVFSADPGVREYKAVMLVVDLGLFEDPEYVYPIVPTVDAAIIDNVGTELTEDNGTTVVVAPKSSVNVYSSKWMTISEYDELMSQRATARSSFNSGTLYNYVERYKTLLAERDALSERVALLEQALEEAVS